VAAGTTAFIGVPKEITQWAKNGPESPFKDAAIEGYQF
jgi:hypothetical protein